MYKIIFGIALLTLVSCSSGPSTVADLQIGKTYKVTVKQFNDCSIKVANVITAVVTPQGVFATSDHSHTAAVLFGEIACPGKPTGFGMIPFEMIKN